MRNILHMKQRNFFSVLAISASLVLSSSAWSQVNFANSAAQPVVPFGSPVTAPVVAPAATAAPAAPAAKSGKPQQVNSIVVVVNDEVITKQEMEERIRTVERRLAAQGTPLPSKAELQKQLLERMIIDRAQIQLAKEDGFRVDDTNLDRAIVRMAEQNKMPLQDFRNQIEREGTPFAKFREEIRDEILMQRVREREVDNKIQVTESEVDNYLAAVSTPTNTAQELNLAQILIRIPENASAEQIALRRTRAEEVMQKLKVGGDFGKLAVTYSDSSEALKGGDLGWREQDRLPQLFVDAVSKLKEGEVSDIIKSPNGFHILKLNGKRAINGAKTAAATAVQQTHARHILIKVSSLVTSAEAKRKLIEIKERLDNNAAKFEDLAKSFSNDLSAAKGGDLGWIYPGDTVPEFEQAMNKLAVNEVSEPIETQFGFHLIQVLERKTDDLSQDRQRAAARQAVRDRKADEALQDWLRQLRDRAYVEFRTEDK